MRVYLPTEVAYILNRLEDAGYKAYVVGGAVRDILMGEEPSDWDVATNALPARLIEIFEHCEVKSINNNTYHVVKVDGHDVATFRVDEYDAEGNPIGATPVETIEEDLARRDLTINAMAMDVRGNLIDPHGGQEDLKNRFVRFVGNALDRINEDPGRIIRYARFNAYIDGLELTELKSMSQAFYLQSQFKKIAPERIRTEILKAMKCKVPSVFFRTLYHLDLLGLVLPSMEKCWYQDGGKYHNENVFEHLMKCGDELGTAFPKHCLEKPIFRLVGYLHDIGKSIPNYVEDEVHFYEHPRIGAELVDIELRALRFTNSEIKYVQGLILCHMRGGAKMAPKTTRKLLSYMREVGVDWEEYLALKVSDRVANTAKDPYTPGRVKKIRNKFLHELYPGEYKDDVAPGTEACLSHKDLAISGTRIQELLGIKPGEIIGVILNHLLQRCIVSPDLNTKEQLEFMVTGRRKND